MQNSNSRPTESIIEMHKKVLEWESIISGLQVQQEIHLQSEVHRDFDLKYKKYKGNNQQSSFMLEREGQLYTVEKKYFDQLEATRILQNELNIHLVDKLTM